MTSNQVIWTIRELVDCIKKRQLNKFDANIVVSGRRGDGKTQVKGNKVLMSDGTWKKVENIKTGDEVISPQENGSFSYEKVLDTHSRFESEVYDICQETRKRKILYSCAWNHEIPLYRVSSKRIIKDGKTINKRTYGKKLCLKNARILSTHYTKGSHYTSFTCPPIQYKNIKKIDVDPYCLGVWLGDGYFTKDLGITSNDIEIINPFLEKYNIMNILKKNNTNAKMYRFSVMGKFSKELISLGLRYKNSSNKFIPHSCFHTSINYRLKLLAGLIDTDGFISKNNQTVITTKSPQLAKDIQKLVFSLGGYSTISKIYKNCQSFKEKRKYYNVAVQFKNPKKIPLQLKRKLDRLRVRKINPTMIAIKSVKRKKGEMVYGFSLTGKSKWYITNNHMVTHNSTLINKILLRIKGFKPKKHQVYSRDDVINLLQNQEFGFCWDDEAINSGYKRDFYFKAQKELIKMVTAYRDNFNIYASAIPSFYSLDKDLRDLIFMHIYILERGVGVIFMPVKDNIHTVDAWDTKNNAKKEEVWQLKKARDPSFKFPYHKLSTFAGYIYFTDLTKGQREKYETIKKEKRNAAFVDKEENGENKKENFLDKLYSKVLERKMTKEGLMQVCLMEGRKYSEIVTRLNQRLTDEGIRETLKKYLTDDTREKMLIERKAREKERLRLRWIRIKAERIKKKEEEEKEAKKKLKEENKAKGEEKTED